MKRLNILRLLKKIAILTNSVKSEEIPEISADFENGGSPIRLPPPPPDFAKATSGKPVRV